jgi:hypothetical protein
MAQRDHKRTRRGSRESVAVEEGAARRALEKDLRSFGFAADDVEAAWSCRDGVQRVAIELMAMGAGLASVEDLAEEAVDRARNAFCWRVAPQIPFAEVKAAARKVWDEWEALTGLGLNERPPTVAGVAARLLIEECEQKLGWSGCPAGNGETAARIIVRFEVCDVIGQQYPEIAAECRRQFREAWDAWADARRQAAVRSASPPARVVRTDDDPA